MSKRFVITEDEKRQIKGLYLINEDDTSCQNETFKIMNGTKVVKNSKTGKEEFTRVELTNEVKKTKDYLDVDRYCNGKIEHSYQASYENGKLSLDQVGA
jgi:hypothetical protein